MVYKTPFKSISTTAFCFVLLTFALTFCDHDENGITKSNATFAFSSVSVNDTDGRVSGLSHPAFLFVSIEDMQGNIANKTIALHAFGSGYTTEGLVLSTGDYKLKKFLVLDSANTTIYATPLVDSYRARSFTDSLPIDFCINKDSNTPIVSHVLAVSDNDTPERFGYLSFDLEVVGLPLTTSLIDLPVKLRHLQNLSSAFDSVAIRFFNPGTLMVKQQRLALDSITHSATGIVKDLPVGDWQISMIYFSTLEHQKESKQETGSATVTLTPSSTSLFSNNLSLNVMDNDDPSLQRTIAWKTIIYLFF